MNSYIISFSILAFCGVLAPTVKNVKGGDLAACSTGEMPATGFTRNGECGKTADSLACPHSMCIDVPNSADFCKTEPSVWCSAKVNGKSIGNWCVCHWSFSNYLKIGEKLGEDNCDKIQVICDASHYKALEALQKTGYETELACLKKKCPASESEEVPQEGKAGEDKKKKPKHSSETKVQADFEDAFIHRMNKKHIDAGIAGAGVIVISLLFWSYYQCRSQKTMEYESLIDGDEI